ncbi:unnamed protein product, partial [Rotaria sp. Silwood1]
MDRSQVASILHELNLNENSVANIYHHGSWVYGTNTPTSDRALIIVTRSSDQKPVKFRNDFDYFHEFELHKLWNQYDVCVYSIENFETLLANSYLCVVQSIFLPNEFKIKEEINFQSIYLEKYYNKFQLKRAVFYEIHRDFNFTEQLIQTRSIHNFKRVSHIFNQMKNICGDPIDNSDMKRKRRHSKLQQLTISSHYYGQYPSIVKHIEEEVHKQFQDFNIIRIKIESSVSNEGIPKRSIDKRLFWDETTNYFEFHYTIMERKDRKGDNLSKLRD